MTEQANDDLFIASLTVAEIWRGVQENPAGKKRTGAGELVPGPDWSAIGLCRPSSPLRRKAGADLGTVDGRRQSRPGGPRSPLDMIVAAIAEANRCILVTDNEKHFAGLKFINPLREAK